MDKSNYKKIAQINYTKPYLFLFLVTCLAASIRLYRLGAYSLWLDEIDSLYAGLVHAYFHAPLFLHLAVLWQPIGQNDFCFRLLSVLFGVLSIPAIWVLTRNILNRESANWAALLLAISPTAVYYSREFRMYSLVLLLSLISWDRFFVWMEKGGAIRALFYIIPTGMMLYTHHYCFFFIIGQALTGMCLRPHRQSLRRMLTAFSVIAVIYVPWLPQLLFLSDRFMKAKFWANPISWNTPFYTIRFLTAHFEPGLLHWAAIASCIVFLSVIGLLLEKNTKFRLIVIFGLPVTTLAAYLVSVILPSSMFVARYVLFLLGPLLIATAVGLTKLKFKPLRYGIFILLIIMQAIAISYQYRNIFAGSPVLEVRPRKEFREAANFIINNWQEGDLVGSTCASGAFPTWYYLTYRADLPNSFLLDINGKYAEVLTRKYNLDSLIKKGYPFLQPTEISSLTKNCKRLWLYESQWNQGSDQNDFYYRHRITLRQLLREKYSIIMEKSFYGVDVRLFDVSKKPPEPVTYIP